METPDSSLGNPSDEADLARTLIQRARPRSCDTGPWKSGRALLVALARVVLHQVPGHAARRRTCRDDTETRKQKTPATSSPSDLRPSDWYSSCSGRKRPL